MLPSNQPFDRFRKSDVAATFTVARVARANGHARTIESFNALFYEDNNASRAMRKKP
jgi:hypothetical protein